jgi:putative hemolysin
MHLLLPADCPLAVFFFASTLLLAAFCLLVSFLYSGIEAGLLSISRARVRSHVHRGEAGAVRLSRLLAHPERLLVAVLLVTNFADVAALILLTEGFVHRMGPWGYAAAGVALLPVYVLGVQLLPKSLFRRFPYRALVMLAGLLEWTFWLLAPVLTVGSWIWRRWGPKMAEGETRRPGLFVAREEFKTLAAEGERTGALTGAERSMIHNVVDFTSLHAREVMAPPPEPWRLAPRRSTPETLGDLLTFARAHQQDHLPVVDASGKLVALVDVFGLLLDRDPKRPADSLLRRRPLVVSPKDAAHRVLRRLRAARIPAAAVVEGEDQFVGIIRARDLLQRLVRGTGT